MYNVLFMAMILTFPMDRGNNYGQYVENTLAIHYVMGAYSLWVPWMFSCGLLIYLQIFVHIFIYKDAINYKHIESLVARIFAVLFTSWFMHICFSWIGKIYLKSEILRTGNDKLLNNLKEGVFVVDETKDKIRFVNEAGEAILRKI